MSSEQGIFSWRCGRVGACAMGVILFLVALGPDVFWASCADCDTNMMVWVSRRMALGDRLYADVFDHRFPLPYQVLECVWRLFGSYEACVSFVHAVCLVSVCLACVFLFEGASFDVCCVLTGFAVMFFHLMPGNMELWFMWFIVLCGRVSGFLLRGEKVGRHIWVLGFLGAATTLLSKPTICVLGVLVMLPGIMSSGKWREFFMIGAASVALLAIDFLFVCSVSGADAVFGVLFGKNVGYGLAGPALWFVSNPVAYVRGSFVIVAWGLALFMVCARTQGRVRALSAISLVFGCVLSLLIPWASYCAVSMAAVSLWGASQDDGIVDVRVKVCSHLIGSFGSFMLLLNAGSLYRLGRVYVDCDFVHEVVGDSKSVAPGWFSVSVPVFRELGIESPYKVTFWVSAAGAEFSDGLGSDLLDRRFEYVVLTDRESAFYSSCLGGYEEVGSSLHGDVETIVMRRTAPPDDGVTIFCDEYTEPVPFWKK